MEATFVFSTIISDEEWQTVPKDVGAKIATFVNEKFEEFITSKALLETKFSQNGKLNIVLLKCDDFLLLNNKLKL